MTDYYTDPDDVDCSAWAQPGVPLERLPRLKLDVPAMRQAARDIVHEPPGTVSAVFASPLSDKRLFPFIVKAIAERNREKESAHDRG